MGYKRIQLSPGPAWRLGIAAALWTRCAFQCSRTASSFHCQSKSGQASARFPLTSFEFPSLADDAALPEPPARYPPADRASRYPTKRWSSSWSYSRRNQDAVAHKQLAHRSPGTKSPPHHAPCDNRRSTREPPQVERPLSCGSYTSVPPSRATLLRFACIRSRDVITSRASAMKSSTSSSVTDHEHIRR